LKPTFFAPTEEKKSSSSKIKKQKTFALAPSPPGAKSPRLARTPTEKSFLVLLFKKEHPFLMTVDLPPFLRGACVASLAPGALLPITSLTAGLASSVLLRSAYDLANPMPVGDERETGRHLLQWCQSVGLTALIWITLANLAGIWFVPKPDDLGPWLQCALALYGAALAVRSLIRMQVKSWRPTEQSSAIIPELDARLPVDGPDAPPMPKLDPMAPSRNALWRSNVPGFVIGLLLLIIAIDGWRMDSLCLARLPG
jgi:hypothetical protein